MSIIGIDTGGTFTDFVRVGVKDGGIETLKIPSTPHDPAEAVLRGLAALSRARAPEGAAPGAERIVHGTTVATNALLEHLQPGRGAARAGPAGDAARGGPGRRLARTALVTNAGFEDLLEIGRQARPDLYALHPEKPPPLVPRDLRFGLPDEVTGRRGARPRVPAPALEALGRLLGAARVEAAAVCFLGSYREGDPAHEAERVVAAALAALGIPVVASAALLPEIREVERFETAVANAALTPLLSRYLERLEAAVRGAESGGEGGGRSLLVMRSDGGLSPAAALAREPVRTLLSGPAGGLVGAARAARRAGIDAFISFDVGGTSTDVALSGAQVRPAGEVGGVRVAVPALDVLSVGAGGGSIAWVDAGGALRVGPRSAGADPGPACYGRGEEATVTDAAFVLGRLDARFLLRGSLAVEPARSEVAVARLAEQLGIGLEAAAHGILEVALAATERAVRRVSIERGEDPRGRTLVAFGGAGGLLAAPLGARLGIGRVLVPEHPGLLSALGMAEAPVLFSRTAALLAPLAALAGGDLDRAFQRLEVEALAAMVREGVLREEVRLVREIDCRYEGQSYEIRFPYRQGKVAADFHAAHETKNGFRDERRPIEVVAAHVTALSGGAPASGPPPVPDAAGALAREAPPPIDVGRAGPLFRREDLAPGVVIGGPAVIGEYSATTWVPGGWRARVLGTRDLLLEAAHG